MFDNQTHYTITNRIPDSEGGGWEFWCVECSYRVRYNRSDPQAGERLEVLDIGDPTARHTSGNSPDATLTSYPLEDGADDPLSAWDQLPPDDVALFPDEYEDLDWLSPELRNALENIVARLDR